MESFVSTLEGMSRDEVFWETVTTRMESEEQDLEKLYLLEKVLKLTGEEEGIGEGFVDASRKLVQRVTDGSRAKSDSVKGSTLLRAVLNVCKHCGLESSRKFALGSSLWKCVASLLEIVNDFNLSSLAVTSMSTTATTILMKSIQAITVGGSEASAAKLLKVLRFFVVSIQRTLNRNKVSTEASNAVIELSVVVHSCVPPSRVSGGSLPKPMIAELSGNTGKLLGQTLKRSFSQQLERITDGNIGTHLEMLEKSRDGAVPETNVILDHDMGCILVLLKLSESLRELIHQSDSSILKFNTFQNLHLYLAGKGELLLRTMEEESVTATVYDLCLVFMSDIAKPLTVDGECFPKLLRFLLKEAIGTPHFGRIFARDIFQLAVGDLTSQKRKRAFEFIAGAAELAEACFARRQSGILQRILAGIATSSAISEMERESFAADLYSRKIFQGLLQTSSFSEAGLSPQSKGSRSHMQTERDFSSSLYQLRFQALKGSTIRECLKHCRSAVDASLTMSVAALAMAEQGHPQLGSQEIGLVIGDITRFMDQTNFADLSSAQFIALIGRHPQAVEVRSQLQEFWIGCSRRSQTSTAARAGCLEAEIEFCRHGKLSNPCHLLPLGDRSAILSILGKTELMEDHNTLVQQLSNRKRKAPGFDQVVDSDIGDLDAQFGELVGNIGKRIRKHGERMSGKMHLRCLALNSMILN